MFSQKVDLRKKIDEWRLLIAKIVFEQSNISPNQIFEKLLRAYLRDTNVFTRTISRFSRNHASFCEYLCLRFDQEKKMTKYVKKEKTKQEKPIEKEENNSLQELVDFSCEFLNTQEEKKQKSEFFNLLQELENYLIQLEKKIVNLPKMMIFMLY